MYRHSPTQTALLPSALLVSLLIVLTGPFAAASSEFDVGGVCGKLNGGGYTNQYLCSQDRKSIIVCQATIDSLLLPTWQIDRACHGDHFCYALPGAGVESQWGNAPMEPNGYPSDDPTSFGCRKLLGLENRKGNEGDQMVMAEPEAGAQSRKRKRSGGSVLGEL